jgi:dephospho-CoA kinase
MKPHLIGVSGKIGSGKDYFAEQVTRVLKKRGYSVSSNSFAAPLKEEATELFGSFYEAEHDIQLSLVTIASEFNIPQEQLEHLYSLVAEEIDANPSLNGYNRSEGVRQFLQYLGTDVRRNQKQSYWVNKFYDSLDKKSDFIFVTDTRFPNEADFVLEQDGTVVRIEVPEEIIEEQVKKRDGLRYSEKALSHPSETALDDYEFFSIVIGRDFSAEDLADFVIMAKSNN